MKSGRLCSSRPSILIICYNYDGNVRDNRAGGKVTAVLRGSQTEGASSPPA
jgi:hypothetical protein